MTDTSGVVIIGAGAQAKYACETFSQPESLHHPVCVIASDGSGAMDWPAIYGADYLVGFDHIEAMAVNREINLVIVCMSDVIQKRQLDQRASQAGLKRVSAIHPAAIIATSATIGPGVIINAGAVVQPLAKIGRGVMIHANVVVEHDCRIADFANLAPGVSLAGWVEVGEGATIFTGASIIPGCKIGAGAIVGAGATVIGDVPAGTRVAGTPAHLIGSYPVDWHE